MRHFPTRLLTLGAAIALLFSVSCKRNDDSNGIKPTGDAPAWAPNISPEMLKVIEQLDSFHNAPVANITVAAARNQSNIFDAARMVAQYYGLSGPVFTSDVSDYLINAGGQQLNARIYRPRGGSGLKACVLYFHGGGWVLGSSHVYDASALAIAEQTKAVVLSIDYRLAPENKFPAAHNDALAAYQWILNNTSFLNIDPNRIAVAGEDAGANLACYVSLAARDSGLSMPKHQLLISPVTEADMNTPSYSQYAAAEPLSKATMNYFFSQYLSADSQRNDIRIDLLQAPLVGLPATTIISPNIDPLRDDALMLETKLEAAGVPVTRTIYDGVTHDFFSMSTLLPQSRDAQGQALNALRFSLQ
ncbi:MAG: alpha/beta hydrolase [Bacteroidetes bacterium]|nr:alpha/beta hydrolase [Bacteroidota bacterium]